MLRQILILTRLYAPLILDHSMKRGQEAIIRRLVVVEPIIINLEFPLFPDSIRLESFSVYTTCLVRKFRMDFN